MEKLFFLKKKNINKLTKIILLGPWICIRRGQTLELKEPLGPDIVISAFNYSGSICFTEMDYHISFSYYFYCFELFIFWQKY